MHDVDVGASHDNTVPCPRTVYDEHPMKLATSSLQVHDSRFALRTKPSTLLLALLRTTNATHAH
jgi:hypothetical protein